MMKHNGPLKTLGPQAAQLVTSLHEDNKLVFRLEDVQRILSLEEPTTRSLVRTLVNRGVAARLKPGLFTLVPFELGREREYLGNPFIVARELAGGKDYFLSHGTAMSIHGMVTQPQLVVHVTTLAPRRPVRIMGTEFRFIASAKDGFFGLADHWVTAEGKDAGGVTGLEQRNALARRLLPPDGVAGGNSPFGGDRGERGKMQGA